MDETEIKTDRERLSERVKSIIANPNHRPKNTDLSAIVAAANPAEPDKKNRPK